MRGRVGQVWREDSTVFVVVGPPRLTAAGWVAHLAVSHEGMVQVDEEETLPWERLPYMERLY